MKGALLAFVLVVICADFAVGWVHPGILVSKTQLDFVKGKIASKTEPWYSAYTSAQNSFLGKSTYTATPHVKVTCVGASADRSKDVGCEDIQYDSQAAYTNALLYYYSGNVAYANQALKLINAWTSTITEITFDSTFTNGLLIASWSGPAWLRAAEILRYTWTGFSSADMAKFTNMINKVYFPKCYIIWSAANWMTSRTDCSLGIAVWNENMTLFNEEIAHLKNFTIAHSYMSTDGPLASKKVFVSAQGYTKDQGYINKDIPGYWKNPIATPNGLWQESCRDMGHTIMGVEAAVNAMETYLIQGVDLYTQLSPRLLAVYELHADWVTRYTDNTHPSDFPCSQNFLLAGAGYKLGFEIFYNHYVCRKGGSMPKTKAYLGTIRPTKSALHMTYETLSHGCSFTDATSPMPPTVSPTPTTTTTTTKAPATTKAPTTTTTTKAPTTTTTTKAPTTTTTTKAPTTTTTTKAPTTTTKAPTTTAKATCTKALVTFQTGSFTPQTNTFSFSITATTTLEGTSNTVVGLSNGNKAAYADFSCLIRFGQNGIFQAFNGKIADYSASVNLVYKANVAYKITFTVNVKTSTYAAAITEPGKSAVTIATGYAFRAAATSLDYFGFKDNMDSTTYCNPSLGGVTLDGNINATSDSESDSTSNDDDVDSSDGMITPITNDSGDDDIVFGGGNLTDSSSASKSEESSKSSEESSNSEPTSAPVTDSPTTMAATDMPTDSSSTAMPTSSPTTMPATVTTPAPTHATTSAVSDIVGAAAAPELCMLLLAVVLIVSVVM